MPKKFIRNPNLPNGGYWGYENSSEVWADYQNELDHEKANGDWTKIGYSSLAVFLVVLVTLTVLAAEFKW